MLQDATSGHGVRTAPNNVSVPTVPNATMSLEDVFVDLASPDSVVIVVSVSKTNLQKLAWAH